MKKGKNLLDNIQQKYEAVPVSEPVVSEENEQVFYRNLSLTFRRREFILKGVRVLGC